MTTAKLKVIHEIPVHAIRLKHENSHTLKGAGDIDTVCGQCEQVMAKGIAPMDLRQLYPKRDVVLECSCGAHNAIPD